MEDYLEKAIDLGFLSSIPDWLMTLGVGSAVFMGVISIIFEILAIIFILTPSEKDDIWLAKVRARWAKWKPYLEWFHIKTPLVKVLAKIQVGLQAIKRAVENFKGKVKKATQPTKLTDAEKTSVLKKFGRLKNLGSTNRKPGLLTRPKKTNRR